LGRKRSNHVCERCGDLGFRRTNPEAVVHYDSKTGKRRTCYVKNYLKNLPPKKYWKHSHVYHKVGSIITHLENIVYKLKKTQSTIFYYPPNKQTSSKCVHYLNMFDIHLLTPLEKILTPYIDERWGANWTTHFKIQMDYLDHGPRASGIINAIETGEYIMELGKDERSVIQLPIAKEFSSKQVKRIGKQTLNMARDVLIKDGLENALDLWSKNTEFEVPMNDPDKFYRREMARRGKKIPKGRHLPSPKPPSVMQVRK